MSKVICIRTREQYQPPKPYRHEVVKVTLPYDDDHYLFPEVMRAYLLWKANKELIKELAWLSVDMMTDRYYERSTEMLIRLDHYARVIKWDVVPVVKRICKRIGRWFVSIGKKFVNSGRLFANIGELFADAWRWREELYREE